MFEQSLYQHAAAFRHEPEPKVDLFRDYEIKTWFYSPGLWKVLSLSAIANLLAILIVGQTSLLTTKGCDSPLVGGVCQVLDTVYIGALLFGTDRDYIDAEYEKVDLGEMDITYIDVGGANAPLQYPEGYFQVANPEMAMYQQPPVGEYNPPVINPFPTTSPGVTITQPQTETGLFGTKPNFPPVNNNVVKGDLPPSINAGTTATNPIKTGPKITGPKLADTTKTPNSNADNTAAADDPNKKPTTSDPATIVDINKRPFVDLANAVNDMLDKKEVKLEAPFVVNAFGKLTKEGKLDPKSFKWGEVSSSDQKMVEVIKEAVEAINESGYLGYLKDISGKDFSLMLQQDDANISAVVQSEMESNTRANSIKSALTLVMDLARSRKSSPTADQNDKDDLVLLQNAKVETDGKKVILRFQVPKEIALPMIQRKLAEQKAVPRQPSGISNSRPNDKTGQK